METYEARDLRANEYGLSDYLAAFSRRRWAVALVLASVLSSAVAFTLLQEPTYRATAGVLVRTSETANLFPLGDALDVTRSVRGERTFLNSAVFTEQTTSMSPSESHVSVTTDDDDRNATNTITFEATAPSAEDAARAATVWSTNYIEQRFELETIELAGSIDAVQRSIEDLRERRAVLVEPLSATDRAIDQSTDPVEIARLGAERILLVDRLAPELDALDGQSLELNMALEAMRVRQDLVVAPEFLARLDQPAEVPERPFSPNIAKNLGLGLVSALMLAAATALVLESLDSRVRSIDEVRAVTNLRHLASIPRLRKRRVTVGLDQAYQRVLSALNLAEAEREPAQVALIASAQAGEGKSSTAIALARLIATGGSRTLLIDADLHRPTAGHRLDVANRRGLCDYLAGSRSVDDIIFPSPNIAHLDVMPSGRLVSSRALDLLRTPQFGVLIEKLRDTYDRIVIDSPPLLMVVDSVEIALHVDCSVLVVRSGQLRAEELSEAQRILLSAGKPILGTVLVAPAAETASLYSYVD